jgi:hypothetical protein
MLKHGDVKGRVGRERRWLSRRKEKLASRQRMPNLTQNNLAITCPKLSPPGIPKSRSRSLLPVPISQLIWYVGLTLVLES